MRKYVKNDKIIFIHRGFRQKNLLLLWEGYDVYMKKKKVLHIVEAMGGGIFTYLVELANGMSEDYNIIIAHGIRNETPENFKEYFNEKVKLIKVNNFVKKLSPVKDLRACFELRKITKKIKPDIIHMHSSKAGAIGRVIFSSNKYKLFYTPHGYSFLMEDISKPKRKIFKLVEKVCGKKNCKTIACGQSEWEKSKTVTSGATLISNGINLDKINNIINSVEHKDDDRFVVYTIGRIDYQKNPELFNQIAKRMPEVKFVWIGDGELKNKLNSPNIEVTGWIDNNGVIEKALKYDVFLLTSKYEGLPISLLESMYMRKACVVSNVVGNRDIIKEGYSGYVCNNANEFADAITEIQRNGLNLEMINNAYNLILEKYNSGWLIKHYKELYDEE